jgi:hypothetical protein
MFGEKRIIVRAFELKSDLVFGLRFAVSGWDHLVYRIKLNQIKRLTTPK